MLGLSVGDLGKLKDFVSPSFFDVLPARRRGHATFERLLGALYEHLSTLGVPLHVRGAFEAVWPS